MRTAHIDKKQPVSQGTCALRAYNADAAGTRAWPYIKLPSHSVTDSNKTYHDHDLPLPVDVRTDGRREVQTTFLQEEWHIMQVRMIALS